MWENSHTYKYNMNSLVNKKKVVFNLYNNYMNSN